VWRWFGNNHSVTIVGGPDSGVKNNGSTYSPTLGPGTYTYYCKIHGDAQGHGMAGTLTLH
jgi:plastocyanin